MSRAATMEYIEQKRRAYADSSLSKKSRLLTKSVAPPDYPESMSTRGLETCKLIQ